MLPIFRESVDSLCRDGTDTPYTQYKIKHSKSLQKNNIKLLQTLNLHFRGFLQPKVPQSCQKASLKQKTGGQPNYQIVHLLLLLLLLLSSFSEASSKLAQAMAVILARKNCIFEREGPRHHIIFITIKLNSKARSICLPLKIGRHFIVLYACAMYVT